MSRKSKALGAIGILAAIFVAAFLRSGKSQTAETAGSKASEQVTLQSVKDSKEADKDIDLPAEVAGDQEVKIVAETSGTIVAKPYSIGSYVPAGAQVARIDDTGNGLKAGENDYRSVQVKQSELSLDEARKAMDQAKKYYADLKNAYDSQGDGGSVTRAQINSAKKSMQIAELQFESARAGLNGTLDDHSATSPIGGYVTAMNVSLGDYVSAGTEIATVSQTKKIKVKFYLSADQLDSAAPGTEVSVSGVSGGPIATIVRNVSPSADPDTRKFLVEAFPKDASASVPTGTVATVTLRKVGKVSDPANAILPLSAVTVGQNESFLFVADNGKARKMTVRIVRVDGESVEVAGDFSEDDRIVIDGAKLVNDGDPIEVSAS